MEMFCIFPAAAFPLDDKHLKRAINNRVFSSVFLPNEQLVRYANLYLVKRGDLAGTGNLIISSDQIKKGLGNISYVFTGIEKYSQKKIITACIR